MSEPATRSEIGQVLDEIKSMRSDIQSMDKKLDIHIAITTEKFNTLEERLSGEIKAVDEKFNTVNEKLQSMDEKLDELTKRKNTTDGRLWAFLVAMFFTVVGLLAKVTLFDKV